LLPVAPGQFANVDIPDNRDVFLRRPFSFFTFDKSRNELSLLVKILGRGSKTLADIQPGERLSLVYPLGKGFTLPTDDDKVLAIGGGSGVAPVLFLAKEAGLRPEAMHVLLGARSESDHIPVTEYEPMATFHMITEDGSLGEKGLVTGHTLFRNLSGYTKIYACGPMPMMRAIAAIAAEKQMWCEVSLENLMACGFGVCLCCIEPTVKGNVCVCTDGPVFNINMLKW
jgi:dihydroorotate dehydrogenase electron transfer subunit